MNPMVKMVLTLALISAGAAAALSAANQATVDKIKAAAAAKADRAVLKIFPDCTAPRKSEVKSPSGEPVVVYRCPQDRVCFSFSSSSASGISRPYSGLVKAMIGIDGKGEIVGMRIIQQTETPGLGNKIVEDKFLDQFKGKSAKSNWKVRKDDPAGVIDGLSGATISSRTVTTLCAAALRFYEETLKTDASGAPGVGPAPGAPGAPGCGAAAPVPAAPGAPGCGAADPVYDNRRPVANPERLHNRSPNFDNARQLLRRDKDRRRARVRALGAEQNGRPVRPMASAPEGGQ